MNTVLRATNTSQLLKQLDMNQGLEVVGGCTRISPLPEKFISVRGIKDLSTISRHERFIDVGPGTTLAQLLNVGKTHLPQLLYDALNSIANPMIRNIATVGGNICNKDHKLTLFAPLMALEAKLEFKNEFETKQIQIQNFKEVPEGFVLTNIRIPIPDADLSIFRRIGPENEINQYSASFAFLATTERNTLLSVKVAFAGVFPFTSKTLENNLTGHRLPLTQKDIEKIEKMVWQEFSTAAQDVMISDVLMQQFMNLVRFSFEQLL